MKTSIHKTTHTHIYIKPIEFFLDVGGDDTDIIGTCEFKSKLASFRSQFKYNSMGLLRKNLPNITEALLLKYDKEDLGLSVYCYTNGLIAIPLCTACGKNNVSYSPSRGLGSYCSISCSINSPERIAKSKATCNSKWGCDFPLQSKHIQQLTQETCLATHGVKFALQSSEILSKTSDTMLLRYGSRHPLDNLEVKQKAVATCIKNWGVTNPFSNKDINNKIWTTRATNFRNRKVGDGNDYSGVVYIIHFTEINYIKIGLTGNFENRAKALRTDFGDFKILYLLETATCYAVEKNLHELYKDHRVCLDKGVGRTEFFNTTILDSLNIDVSELQTLEK